MTPIRALLVASPLLVACSSASGTLKVSGANASAALESTGASHGDLGDKRFKADVCKGIDLKPEFATLDEKAVVEFLKQQGFESTTERARNDLVYVDVKNVGTNEPVRLRVAILKSAHEAGNELHTAILQHGPGSWGVHRSNLAVLGPNVASAEDAVALAVKTKLACWGVFTIAGRDDTFVISGAYFEL